MSISIDSHYGGPLYSRRTVNYIVRPRQCRCAVSISSISMSYSMQLCLVNNDPTATLLVTPDGIPLFSVETPPVPHMNTRLNAVGEPRPKGATTKIKRLERFHMSTGHVETEIGVVSYNGPCSSTQLRLSEEENRLLEVPPRKALTDFEAQEDDQGDYDSPDEKCAQLYSLMLLTARILTLKQCLGIQWVRLEAV